MKIACVCFTGKGAETAEKVRCVFQDKESDQIDLYTKQSHAGEESASGKRAPCIAKALPLTDGTGDFKYIEESLREWTGRRFNDCDALIFVGACGIAVRSAAPFLKSKKEDPAVLVIDELGTWVISLVSGHLGGANVLTRMIAEGIGAQPVITTATDLNEKFAVDVFAQRNGLYITSMELAKEISAAVLSGTPVGLYCEEGLFPEGEIPEGIVREGEIPEKAEVHPNLGISISFSGGLSPFRKTLSLIPQCLVFGIGCRKEKNPGELEAFLLHVLKTNHISIHAVKKLCSVDVKADEEAIVLFSKKYRIPFETFTARQLSQVPGRFQSSSFVEATVGVDNVCERSAVLGAAAGNVPGKLIVAKHAYNGMTAALAMERIQLRF